MLPLSQARLIGGDVTLSGFIQMMHNIQMPTDWIWDVWENEFRWPQIDLHAVPWYPRCDVESENMLVICETPADGGRVSRSIRRLIVTAEAVDSRRS